MFFYLGKFLKILSDIIEIWETSNIGFSTSFYSETNFSAVVNILYIIGIYLRSTFFLKRDICQMIKFALKEIQLVFIMINAFSLMNLILLLLEYTFDKDVGWFAPVLKTKYYKMTFGVLETSFFLTILHLC